MRTAALRGGVVVAAVGLGFSVLAPTPARADQAAAGDAGDWLVSQLVDGDHLERFGEPDVGLSIDAAFALAETGRHEPSVSAIADYVEANVDAYATPFEMDGFASTPVNQAAKTAVLAQSTGADASSFGGADLIRIIERVTPNRGRLAGRISERSTFNGEPQPDLANTFGQAFAARALTEARSPEAAAVRTFLLAQQCRAGFFRLSFAKAGRADQSCDGAGKAVAHVDATAITVLQLGDVPGKAVARAVDRAVAWLQSRQRDDGSFVDAAGSSGVNANSTGLAGWALAEEGAARAARKAGRWVREHQLVNVEGCSPFAAADLGAVAYDDSAFEDAADEGAIGDADQFARATAQALPALLSAPAGTEVDPCA